MEHFGEKCMRETMFPLVKAIQILINAENILITLYKFHFEITLRKLKVFTIRVLREVEFLLDLFKKK